MAFVSNAKNIICASKDTPLCFCVKGVAIRAINSVTGELAKTYRSGEGCVTCLAMNPGLDVMVCGDENGVVSAQASKTGNHYWTNELNDTPVAMIATEVLCFICLELGRVEARWLTDGKLLWKRNFASNLTCMELLNDCFLVIGSRAGKVMCLGILDGKVVYKSEVSKDPDPTFEKNIRCMAVSDSGLVACGNTKGEVVCREGYKDEVLWTQESGAQVVTIQLNDTRCVTGDVGGVVRCWKVDEFGELAWQVR